MARSRAKRKLLLTGILVLGITAGIAIGLLLVQLLIKN